MNQEIPKGLTAKFFHQRYVEYPPPPAPHLGTNWRTDLKDLSYVPVPRLSAEGGRTLCQLVDEEGKVMAEGLAVCSRKDVYRKLTGRNRALGLALHAYHRRRSEA